MQKSEIKIFIVEDDQTMAKAMEAAVKSLGMQPVVCPTPDEALNQFRIRGAQFFIIDCLLPKKSGVDLAVQLRTQGGADVPIVLTSGIYKDKTFSKDALHKTGAIAFLPKPFNIKDLTDLILKSTQGMAEEDISPLEALMVTSPTPGEKIKFINALEEIHAFDIPWLCSMLMNPSVSGTLELTHGPTKSSISFSSGQIVQVFMQNPESFFGALLIENEYLTPEQLDTALKAPSQKRLGERLVELNFLSPHVIDMINAEQMAIRLSKLIFDTSYGVKFVEQIVEPSNAHIDLVRLATFLTDWINSKISPSFLRQRYLKWLNCPVAKPQSPGLHKSIFNLAPLSTNPQMVQEFQNGTSLGQVLGSGRYKEDLVYEIFHLLVMTENLRLKKETRPTDESSQISRLQKLLGEMQKQDYFAALGVRPTAKAPEIKRSFHELAKIFHPDKLPSNATAQLKDLAQKVFSQMSKAYDTLSDDKKREQYLKELDMGRAEKVLQSESLIEEGKALLKSGQAVRAREKLEAALSMRPPTSELLIFLAWAKLMGGEATIKTQQDLMDIETGLGKIPPEDRHNVNYYFVKALFQKLVGDPAGAKKNAQLALSLDPKFIEAERLMRVLDLEKGQKVDLLRGDLKDVMGAIFAPKKK